MTKIQGFQSPQILLPNSATSLSGMAVAASPRPAEEQEAVRLLDPPLLISSWTVTLSSIFQAPGSIGQAGLEFGGSQV